jgi:hypothetical protein
VAPSSVSSGPTLVYEVLDYLSFQFHDFPDQISFRGRDVSPPHLFSCINFSAQHVETNTYPKIIER